MERNKTLEDTIESFAETFSGIGVTTIGISAGSSPLTFAGLGLAGFGTARWFNTVYRSPAFDGITKNFKKIFNV